MVLQLAQEKRVSRVFLADNKHIGIGIVVLNQIGYRHDETHIPRFHLHYIGAVDDDRLSVRERVDHRNAHSLGIFFNDLKRLAEERSDNQVQVLTLNLA